VFLPHMLLELVRATVAISFVVATAWELTVMANAVVNVQDVTVKVGCASEGLGAIAIDARYLLGWFSRSYNAYHTVGQALSLRNI